MTYDFSKEFQQDVVCCMLDNEFLKENREVLHWQHFVSPELQQIAQVVLDYYDDRQQAPSKGVVTDTIRKELDQARYGACRRVLNEVLKLKSVDKKYVAHRIRHFASTATCLQLFAEFEEASQNGGLDKWHTDVNNALDLRHPPPSIVHHSVDMERRFKAYKGGYKKLKPIPTGIPELDESMLGGLDAGEMALMLGLPGMGKTHLMIQFGVTAVRLGFKVYHFSLEMSKRAIQRRYDSCLTGVPVQKIARFWKKYTKELKGLPLWISHHSAYELSVGELRSTLDRIGPPDLLIVDYPSLLRQKHTGDWSQTRFAVEYNYLMMRNIAGEYNCAVWTPFQSNRSGHQSTLSDGDHITKENLAEAYGPSRHADIICSWNQTHQEEEDGEGRIWKDKDREGVDNISIPVRIDKSMSIVEGVKDE